MVPYFYKVLKRYRFFAAFALLLTVVLPACKEETPEERMMRMGIGYFSINQYLYDQFKNYDGRPITILKTIKLKDKEDTVYTNSEKFDWTEVLDVLKETDISDKDLLGHYKYRQYVDDATKTINFYYDAQDDYLLTRQLLIVADEFTYHIRSIYIETIEHSMVFGDKKQFIFYVPLKHLQIQETKAPVFGQKSRKVASYYFSH